MAYDKAVDSTKLDAGLTTIADAIRAKGGTTEPLDFPNGMAAAVEAIDTNLFPPDEIPDYVKAEAVSVAERVRAVQTDKAITFIAVSDSHHLDGQNISYSEHVNAGNLHMAMAVKILAYLLRPDFAVQLGDFSWGHTSTTKQQLIDQGNEINRWLSESYPYFVNFRTTGNHDTGEYRAQETGSLSDLTGIAELNRLVNDYNTGAVYGSDDFGYCYRDFPAKKLRVICLNTCEEEVTKGVNPSHFMSQAQLGWFANTMLDLGSKADSANWSFLALGHFPMDFGLMMECGHILRAYVEGFSVSVNGSTVNFAGHNGAKFIGYFHGHIHNYRVAKIRDTVDGQPSSNNTPYDAKEIAVPNSCFYRNNERKAPFYGIEYGEEITYAKTADSAKDTAFVVNVVDMEAQVIHSIHYGAGRDRVIGYAKTVYYGITADLTNATLSNTATSVEAGQPFATDIVIPDKYQLDSIAVMMGGSDISDAAVSGKRISISAVTGDVAITVVASKMATYTNQVPISTDTDGSIFNGTGYKDLSRINSDGTVTEPSPASVFTATGFIPVPAEIPYTIRVGGSAKPYDRKLYGTNFCFYDANKKFIARFKGSDIGKSIYWGDVTEEANTSTTWTITGNTSAMGDITNAHFIRFGYQTGETGKPDGAGLICTIDEPIE